MMRSIVVRQFGGPEVLEFEESPIPTPGHREILVRVHAAGVNPVDTYIRAGTYASKPSLPYTPGTDAAGEVLAIGENVKAFVPGQRVYVAGPAAGRVFGAYSSHMISDEAHLHLLPENVTYQQGAGVNVPYVTAYRALFHRAEAKPNETVLIHGASGGVGIAAVQLSAAIGMNVIGTASTPRGIQLVKDQGASHVLNHSKAGYLDELLDLTGGNGPDVILEMLANVNLDKDLSVIARHGRVVIIGNRGRIEIDPRKTMAKESSIMGVGASADEKKIAEVHAYLVAGLARGTILPVVGQELPLKDAAKAHVEVMKSGSYGKIVLIP